MLLDCPRESCLSLEVGLDPYTLKVTELEARLEGKWDQLVKLKHRIENLEQTK